MVDNVNPASQFHPYQPETSTPQSERTGPTGFGGLLKKAGLDRTSLDALGSRIGNFDVRGRMNEARAFARSNPGLVLGGLTALAIGAGLLRRPR